jgi:DNA (cytosine-5)-methyltransferase 1
MPLLMTRSWPGPSCERRLSDTRRIRTVMTHLDLFTGIGGFHLAAEWAGFETIGFSEIEPYCCRLLAEKWPSVKNYGDIRGADFSPLRASVTVLSAGVPCQPASLAGKRRGKADDRWLWEATLDVVGCVQPAWVLLENPPGILTLDEFGGVLLRLESLGYALRAFGVPANAVGAKHRRQRVFIIGNADSGNHRECCQSGWRSESGSSGEALADAAQRSLRLGESWGNGTWRLTESPLCRRADGVSNRSHRLKALGNAVVPQQAFPFFAAIAEVETCLKVSGF